MAHEFGKKLEEMSLDELEARFERLVKAIRADTTNDPQVQQYRQDEIDATIEAIHRKKGGIMSDCGCEGSCPICRVGEVDNHECNSCGAKFCPKCHGIINPEGRGIIPSLNVLPCRCDSKS